MFKQVCAGLFTVLVALGMRMYTTSQHVTWSMWVETQEDISATLITINNNSLQKTSAPSATLEISTRSDTVLEIQHVRGNNKVRAQREEAAASSMQPAAAAAKSPSTIFVRPDTPVSDPIINFVSDGRCKLTIEFAHDLEAGQQISLYIIGTRNGEGRVSDPARHIRCSDREFDRLQPNHMLFHTAACYAFFVVGVLFLLLAWASPNKSAEWQAKLAILEQQNRKLEADVDARHAARKISRELPASVTEFQRRTKQVISTLRQTPTGLTRRELAERLQVDPATIRKPIRYLGNMEVIQESGRRRCAVTHQESIVYRIHPSRLRARSANRAPQPRT